MVVAGRYIAILVDTEWTVEVRLFIPNYKSLHKVPTVYIATEFNYSYSEETFILVNRNTLHILSINYNLIPLFIIKDVVLDAQTILKIYVCNPTI